MAPFTDAMEYVLVVPSHTVAAPLMVDGVLGIAFTSTASDCAPELPQVLSAVTEIVPPAALAVALILSVVDVPLQPFGKDQV